VLPPSLELLRKVEEVLATIDKLDDEATVRSRVAALNFQIAEVNATVVEGPTTRLGALNADQVVTQWRLSRSDGGPTRCSDNSCGGPPADKRTAPDSRRRRRRE
jgi:hypothetical protein